MWSVDGHASIAVLAAAIAIDIVAGEPPSRVHPVVWMGRLVGAAARRGLAMRSATAQLLFGAVIAVGVPALFAGGAWLVLRILSERPVLHFAAATFLLTSSFAIRALGRAATDVRDALGTGRLADARDGLRSLCSRDATTLEAPALIAATVESVAENASDSIVAPLFYYALLGVPGAVAYRAVNTMDAMIGYRGRYERLGKTAARLDDALNFVPARLTAAALLAAGWLARADARRGWRILARDGGSTSSPNAGRPMAAMAGLLGVVLEKPGEYRLGAGAGAGEPLTLGAIDQAWRLVVVATALVVAAAAVAIGAMHATA